MGDLLDVEIARRSLGEMAPRFKILSRAMPRYVATLEDWQARAREFATLHVRPRALEIDARCRADPRYFDWELVRRSTPYGFLSMLVPEGLGGGGQLATGTALVLEELCAACAGIANVFGANALGVSGLLLGFDLYLYERVLTDLVRGDRRGEPVLFAAAITEPAAGSDVEDREYLATARLSTEVRRSEGGYRVDGRKVFISNGSVARWVTLVAPIDRQRPVETMSAFMVRAGDPGFEVGRVEDKMGQKACPAAELVFDDCFLPAERLVRRENQGARFTELVLGASRAPVGAIATGIARGAFERLFAHACEKRTGGRRLVDQQWVQMRLADMARRIHLSRQAYLDGAMAFDFTGMGRLLDTLPAKVATGALPGWLRGSRRLKSASGAGPVFDLVQHLLERRVDPADVRDVQRYASMAKVSASDVAVEIAQEALQIVGLEPSRVRVELEKIYRDAKLTQIYEGTNQLNRHNIFVTSFPETYRHGDHRPEP